MKTLVKISGDLVNHQSVLTDIKNLAKENQNVDVVFGFGTILSDALNKQNIPFSYIHGIRQTTEEGLAVALRVSEEIRNELKNTFKGHANITLVSPVEKVGEKIVNTNADEVVLQRKHEYDTIIVYTKEGRSKEKLQKQIPTITIRSIA